ncbi:unnamed protein product [Polarella glacialis]|uniref:Uncharacterized protein n=1 Tax=Polarella glacialis TaxID=89957 RepID=A0A813KGN4_POLGL|nr:unnamed protein product [Polarella glacialis]
MHASFPSHARPVSLSSGRPRSPGQWRPLSLSKGFSVTSLGRPEVPTPEWTEQQTQVPLEGLPDAFAHVPFCPEVSAFSQSSQAPVRQRRPASAGSCRPASAGASRRLQDTVPALRRATTWVPPGSPGRPTSARAPRLRERSASSPNLFGASATRAPATKKTSRVAPPEVPGLSNKELEIINDDDDDDSAAETSAVERMKQHGPWRVRVNRKSAIVRQQAPPDLEGSVEVSNSVGQHLRNLRSSGAWCLVVETCHQCASHAMTTRHDPHQYESVFKEVVCAAAEQISVTPKLVCVQLPTPSLGQRMGACEVFLLPPLDTEPGLDTAPAYLIHSKLMTRTWPSVKSLGMKMSHFMPVLDESWRNLLRYIAKPGLVAKPGLSEAWGALSIPPARDPAHKAAGTHSNSRGAILRQLEASLRAPRNLVELEEALTACCDTSMDMTGQKLVLAADMAGRLLQLREELAAARVGRDAQRLLDALCQAEAESFWDPEVSLSATTAEALLREVALAVQSRDVHRLSQAVDGWILPTCNFKVQAGHEKRSVDLAGPQKSGNHNISLTLSSFNNFSTPSHDNFDHSDCYNFVDTGNFDSFTEDSHQHNNTNTSFSTADGRWDPQPLHRAQAELTRWLPLMAAVRQARELAGSGAELEELRQHLRAFDEALVKLDSERLRLPAEEEARWRLTLSEGRLRLAARDRIAVNEAICRIASTKLQAALSARPLRLPQLEHAVADGERLGIHGSEGAAQELLLQAKRHHAALRSLRDRLEAGLEEEPPALGQLALGLEEAQGYEVGGEFAGFEDSSVLAARQLLCERGLQVRFSGGRRKNGSQAQECEEDGFLLVRLGVAEAPLGSVPAAGAEVAVRRAEHPEELFHTDLSGWCLLPPGTQGLRLGLPGEPGLLPAVLSLAALCSPGAGLAAPWRQLPLQPDPHMLRALVPVRNDSEPRCRLCLGGWSSALPEGWQPVEVPLQLLGQEDPRATVDCPSKA